MSSSTPENLTGSQKTAHARTSLESLEGFRLGLSELLAGARYSLHVLSQDLPDLLWSIDNLSAELTRINREARSQCRIHILVKDPHLLIHTPHRLAHIHQRLPTIVKIRQLRLSPDDDQMNYVIGDQQHVLFQHQQGIYTGYYAEGVRAEARDLLDEFDELWHRHSSDISELKQFSL